MSKVKVLYFVDRMLIGGIQKFIIENLKKMDFNKISIDVLVLDDGNHYDGEDTLKNMGCNVYKLEGVWLRKPADFLKYKKELNNFFKKHHDYKVVHLHSSSKNYIVLKYAKRYGIPVRIAHSHNVNFQTKNKFKKIIGDLLKKQLKKYATDYFACANIAGEWLFGKKAVQNGKVRVIHNGIDIEKFKYNEKIRNEIRKELNIKETDFVIGNVGRFSNQKNHLFLIDIFNEIQKVKSNSKLLLIGQGELEEEIRNKVKNLDLNDKVIFAGFKSNVNDYMQAMDIFIMASLYEGLPVVGIEAQASGLPCFMSKNVITNEVKITNSVKFISLNDSPKDWANIILKSDLSRKDNLENLKKAGYFVEDTAKKLVDFYLNE